MRDLIGSRRGTGRSLVVVPLAVDPGAFPALGFHGLMLPRVGVTPAQGLAGGQLFHFFLCHVAIRVETGQEVTLSQKTPFFPTESVGHTRWLHQRPLHAFPARALVYVASRQNNELSRFDSSPVQISDLVNRCNLQNPGGRPLQPRG